MILLEPMTEQEFQQFLERSIARRAARWVERGIWAREEAVEACRRSYAEFLPQGRATPHHHLCNLLEATGRARVGEAWYSASEDGGKVQFWIRWLGIDPPFRRQGHATEALRLLEGEARKFGADRTILTVWTDNPEAMALYAASGYTANNITMVKKLAPSSQEAGESPAVTAPSRSPRSSATGGPAGPKP